jgi:phosphotransferase system HPr (HPr) family protein
MKLVEEILIRLPLGLHARPASTMVRLLQGKASKVTVKHGDRSANGRSIVELLMLAAKKGERVEVTVEGEDAADVMETLRTAFDRGLELG